MSRDTNKSDVLSRFRTYDPPPEGFDPLTAPDEVLLRHGLPRRPDPDTEPDLTRMWNHAFARRTKYVKAELAIDPVMSNRNPLLAREDPPIPQGSWGGIVLRVDSPSTDPATMVFGQWVVPTVLEVNPAGQDLRVGFWVGLDGYYGDGGQILQAGIRAKVSSSFFGASVQWDAWTEWYVGGRDDTAAILVSNFRVVPGDTVCFLVGAVQPDHGFVSMINLTWGVQMSVGITAPHGITSAGTSAEWIVEPQDSDLPYFYAVEFSHCYAATPTRFFELTPHGFPVNIVGGSSTSSPNGNEITNAYIESPTRAIVQWKGWD